MAADAGDPDSTSPAARPVAHNGVRYRLVEFSVMLRSLTFEVGEGVGPFGQEPNGSVSEPNDGSSTEPVPPLGPTTVTAAAADVDGLAAMWPL